MRFHQVMWIKFEKITKINDYFKNYIVIIIFVIINVQIYKVYINVKKKCLIFIKITYINNKP